jgi:hypothetical protein
VLLPLTQVIVFLLLTAAPDKTTVAIAEAGANMEVPAWVAVTAQFPFLNRFKVDPVIEHIPAEAVE